MLQYNHWERENPSKKERKNQDNEQEKEKRQSR